MTSSRPHLTAAGRRPGRVGRGAAPAAWVPRARTLHLHDIENLVGGPKADEERVAVARDEVASVAPPVAGDHVIGACDRSGVLRAFRAWFPCLRLSGTGPDGADLALLAAARPDDVSRRYHRVVIGSGDHIFLPLVHELRRRGTEVWLVARPGSAARGLLRAADVVCFLPREDEGEEAHAPDGPRQVRSAPGSPEQEEGR